MRKRIHHPYHIKKSYVSWRMRLLKHRHTAKLAHHQHTSFAVLGFLLLVVGVVIARPAADVYAATSGSDYLVVSAVVTGAVPTKAATIDTPDEDQNFTATPIAVTGTCETKTYVQLFRNEYASGTALCTSAGTYAISTDLFVGKNDLVVRTYNYAMQLGPDSDTRHVTYAPPVIVPPIEGSGQPGIDGGSSGGTTPSTPSGGTGTTGSGISPSTGTGNSATTPRQPLILHNDYIFRGFYTGQLGGWQVTIQGGTAPYSIHVNWGDGSDALYTAKAVDTLTLSHAYANASPDGGYRIIVTASDAAGSKTSLQVLALVADGAHAGAAAGSSSGGSVIPVAATIFGVNAVRFMAVLGILYACLCIILLSFWLGEAREIRVVRSRYRLTRI